jgi:hypothetical protein
MWTVFAVRDNDKFRKEYRSLEAAQDICKDLYMDGYDRIGIRHPNRNRNNNSDRGKVETRQQ